jgi:hypothetical protein
MTTCTDCGAAIADDDTCRGMFERLLAHENTFPEAFGAVHHLTVAVYSLQHPRGYSRDAIRMWQVIIAESLDGASTPENFLERARAHFTGGVRVREPGAEPPEGWPRVWPVTVADVVTPPDETPTAAAHVERVLAWARSVRTSAPDEI